MSKQNKDLFSEPKSGLYKLIDGMKTNQLPIGYCCYSEHRGYLTKSLMQSKECNKKCCRHFKKNMEHPWWQRKERIKALKNAKKDGKLMYVFNGNYYLVDAKI